MEDLSKLNIPGNFPLTDSEDDSSEIEEFHSVGEPVPISEMEMNLFTLEDMIEELGEEWRGKDYTGFTNDDFEKITFADEPESVYANILESKVDIQENEQEHQLIENMQLNVFTLEDLVEELGEEWLEKDYNNFTNDDFERIAFSDEPELVYHEIKDSKLEEGDENLISNMELNQFGLDDFLTELGEEWAKRDLSQLTNDDFEKIAFDDDPEKVYNEIMSAKSKKETCKIKIPETGQSSSNIEIGLDEISQKLGPTWVFKDWEGFNPEDYNQILLSDKPDETYLDLFFSKKGKEKIQDWSNEEFIVDNKFMVNVKYSMNESGSIIGYYNEVETIKVQGSGIESMINSLMTVFPWFSKNEILSTGRVSDSYVLMHDFFTKKMIGYNVLIYNAASHQITCNWNNLWNNCLGFQILNDVWQPVTSELTFYMRKLGEEEIEKNPNVQYIVEKCISNMHNRPIWLKYFNMLTEEQQRYYMRAKLRKTEELVKYSLAKSDKIKLIEFSKKPPFSELDFKEYVDNEYYEKYKNLYNFESNKEEFQEYGDSNNAKAENEDMKSVSTEKSEKNDDNNNETIDVSKNDDTADKIEIVNDKDGEDFVDESSDDDELIGDEGLELFHKEFLDEIKEKDRVDDVCFTAIENGEIQTKLVPLIYQNCIGKTCTLINMDCFISMYKEMASSIKWTSRRFFSSDCDEQTAQEFLQSVRSIFKFRHDLFSWCATFCFSRVRPTIFGTDTSFNDFFGENVSEKNRTPDIIEQIKGKNLIIEVSVTSDYRKSLLQKGTDITNSKYKEELSKLIETGKDITYFNLYLDTNTGDENFTELLKLLEDCGLHFDQSQANDVMQTIKEVILSNRHIEKLGHLIFANESISWNHEIKGIGNSLRNVFVDRLNLKQAVKPSRIELRLNKHAIEMIKLNFEVLCRRLFSPHFDDKKVAIYVYPKTVEIKPYNLGSYPDFVLACLQNNELGSLRSIILVKSGNEWVSANKKPPFANVGNYTLDVDDDYYVNNHDHVTRAEGNLQIDEQKNWVPRLNYETDPIPFTDFIKCSQFNKKNLLSGFYINDSVFLRAQDKFNEKMKVLNSNKAHNPKNVFTLPFCDAQRMVKTQNNISMFGFTQTETHVLLYKKFKDNNGTMKRSEPNAALKIKLSEANDNYRKVSNIIGSMNGVRRIKMRQVQKLILENKVQPSLADDFNNAVENLKKLNKEIKESMIETKTDLVKLNKMELSLLKKEYKWLDKNRSNIDRHFSMDSNVDFEEIFNLILASMFSKQKNVDYSSYFESLLSPGNDTLPMLKLKELMMKSIKDCSKEFKDMSIVLMAEFISQFIYTLTYASKRTMRGDRFFYSNLGWEDCSLFVRGGKSINQTGDSRQFRISFPVPQFFMDNRGYLFSESTLFEKNEKGCFILTPWMNLHEKVLADMINCKEKVVVNLLTYANRVLLESPKIHYHNIGFNFFLMFNNRRGTEAMLSDLRYPIVNSMGIYSDIVKLYEGLAKSPSDFCQAFVLNSLKSYHKFVKSQDNYNDKEFQTGIHLFTKKPLLGVTDFTFLIYCTYMLTKAPYKQHIEQSHNLNSMMEIHKEFVDLMEGNLTPDINEVLDKTENEDPEKVFMNDFNFSPKFSFLIGKRLSEYLLNKKAVVDINDNFYKHMTKGWYSIENESGLRSNKLEKNTEDNFFGRKSHEVVAKFMLDEMMKSGQDVKDILNKIKDSDLDILKKSKELSKYDISFADILNSDATSKTMRFHVVDKTQWKGSREIYVMTINTKIHQNPLEGFFKDMCQKVENEIISIPSAKRSTLIHGQLYENKYMRDSHKTFTRYNLTLDCRKWGPKTNFNKYLYFLLGCSDILPGEMIEYFAYFTKIYNEKEVIISPKAAKVFANNIGLKEKVKFLEEVKPLETYKFTMPYSFVMGIFNYLSSLYHAACQIYATEKITEHIWQKHKVMTVFKMNAHSDDSGGYILIPKKSDNSDNYNEKIVLSEMLSLYEVMLKYGNMMLSTKKCVVSKIYFELLSILYVHDRLLPMVPKFFGNISMKPTMAGYTQDISQGYSKTIEVLQNGATFSEAYLLMRAFSTIYRNFYHLKNVDSDRPISCYGGLYSHPLIVLLTGAKSDNIRLYKHDKKRFNQFQTAIMYLTGEEKESFKQQGLSLTTYKIVRNSVKSLKQSYRNVYDNWIIPQKGDQMFWSDNLTSYWDLTYFYFTDSKTGIVKDITEDKLYLEAEGKLIDINIPVELNITRNCFLKNNLTRPLTLINNQFNDPDFINSIAYVNLTRRITQLFSTASSQNVMTTLGNINQKYAPELIEATAGLKIIGEKFPGFEEIDTTKLDEYSEKIDKLFAEILGDSDIVYDYISDSVITETYLEKNSQKTRITTKPCHLNMILDPNSFIVKYDPGRIYYSQTSSEWLFNESKSFIKDKEFIIKRLIDLGLNPKNFSLFTHYSRNLSKSHSKDFYLYANVDSSFREIQDVNGLVSLVETNSVYGYRLMKLFKNLKLPTKLKNIKIDMGEEVNHCLKLLKICFYMKQNYKKLDVNYKGYNLLEYIRNQMSPICHFLSPQVQNNSDMVEKNYFYGWIKKQINSGGKWRGPGILLFKCIECIFEVHINNNILRKLIVNIHPKLLNGSLEFEFLFVLLTQLNIQIQNNMSTFTNELVVANKNGICVSHEHSTDYHYCEIQQDEGLNRIFNWKVKSDRLYSFFANNIKFTHVAMEHELDLDIEQLTGLPEHLRSNQKNISLKNYESFIEEFAETSVYKYCIERKLKQDYKFIEILKYNCQQNGIMFNDMTILKLEEVMGMNLDLNIMPNEIYWAIRNSESYFNIKGCYDEFVNDLSEELQKTEDNADWSKLMKKWGPSAGQEITALARIKLNPELLEDAYELMKTVDLSHQLEVLEETLIKVFEFGFSNSFKDPDWGSFCQFKSIEVSDFKRLLYIIRFESCINQYHSHLHNQSRVSEFLLHIYRDIFESPGYFNLFKKEVQKDNIFNMVICSPDNYKKWAIFHYVSCKTKGKIQENYMHEKDFNDWEKKIRLIGSQGETKSGPNAKFTTLNLFLSTLPNMCGFKFKNKMKGDIMENKIIRFHESPKISNFYSGPTDKLWENINEYDCSESLDQYTQSVFDHKKLLDEVEKNNKIKKKLPFLELTDAHNLDIPVIKTIGAPLLGQIASTYNYCLLITTSLPADIAKFYGQVKVYNGVSQVHNKLINGITFYITYRINFSLGKIWGLKEIQNFSIDHINDIHYNRMDKKYMEYSKAKYTVTFIKENETQNENDTTYDNHGHHDCNALKDEYIKNPKFIDCFLTIIYNHKQFTKDEEFAKVMKNVEMLSNNKNYIVIHYVLNNYLKKLDLKENKKLTLSELMSNTLSSMIPEILKKNIELEMQKIDLNNRETRRYIESYNTNSYSPIDKNTEIYQELNFMFGENTDKLLNRDFEFSLESRNKLLMNIETKIMMFDRMYKKFHIVKDHYKAMKLILRWFKCIIRTSRINNDYEGDKIMMDNILDNISNEFMDKITDIEGFFSEDEDDEPDYM
jgi:hypothetical protein